MAGICRALAIKDSRLGNIGQTPGDFDSTLGTMPLNKWTTLVATWLQGASGVTYMDGMAGLSRSCLNGVGSNTDELLVIGGRGPEDYGHNPTDLDVSHFQVYDKILTAAEVKQLVESFDCSARV